MPESNAPKPKCPKCEVELVLVDGHIPKKCEKCGFRIAGFATFQEWFATAQKHYEKGKKQPPQPTAQTDDDDSIFGALADL